MTQVAEDLARAVDVLNDRGWCQKAMWNASGAVCAVGAIRVATTGKVSEWLTLEESGRFHEARETFTDWLGAPPTVWNDTPGQTVAEVSRTLLKAARRV